MSLTYFLTFTFAFLQSARLSHYCKFTGSSKIRWRRWQRLKMMMTRIHFRFHCENIMGRRREDSLLLFTCCVLLGYIQLASFKFSSLLTENDAKPLFSELSSDFSLLSSHTGNHLCDSFNFTAHSSHVVCVVQLVFSFLIQPASLRVSIVSSCLRLLGTIA